MFSVRLEFTTPTIFGPLMVIENSISPLVSFALYAAISVLRCSNSLRASLESTVCSDDLP